MIWFFCFRWYCYLLSSYHTYSILRHIFAAFSGCVIMSIQVFDQYVKTRAEEERKEKKNKLMQAKDEFRRMMEDAKLTPR